MTTPEPLLPPAEPYSPPSTLPPYPPYISERQVDGSHLPESTLEKLHGDDGVIITPPNQTLGPAPLAHGPNYIQSPNDPHVWYPDNRPLPPGSTVPASYQPNHTPKPADSDDKNAPADPRDPQHGTNSGPGQLNVNPADLLKTADSYTELANRVAAMSPRVADEVQRVVATHGPMGYPVAVGILRGMVPADQAATAKAADFGKHAERFTEHAAAYSSRDAEGAANYAGIQYPTV
ncbi:type VII secretion target (plasmid) [Mycolicibacterium aubagnense]|uniref:type VII secretion target n=1 Tax=Mycolicibacterium aubagnense TaxID=319707 RepID=UPI0013F5D7D6|nr:type VII secretion target [Mycolicibacterium aubagnense]WGI35970.1 type VII secretion target [Mycolicibacterium aubagnense]